MGVAFDAKAVDEPDLRLSPLAESMRSGGTNRDDPTVMTGIHKLLTSSYATLDFDIPALVIMFEPVDAAETPAAPLFGRDLGGDTASNKQHQTSRATFDLFYLKKNVRREELSKS